MLDRSETAFSSTFQESDLLETGQLETEPSETDTPTSLHETVEAVLAQLRPIMRRDGGDMTLVGIDGDTVVIDLKGACMDCALVQITVAGIAKRLFDATGRRLRVEPLGDMPAAWWRRRAS